MFTFSNWLHYTVQIHEGDGQRAESRAEENKELKAFKGTNK